MPVTRNQIIEKLESLLSEEITIPDPTGTPTVDTQTGIVTYPTITDSKYNIYIKGPTKDMIEALVDATLDQIDLQGLEMGPSLADSLDVGGVGPGDGPSAPGGNGGSGGNGGVEPDSPQGNINTSDYYTRYEVTNLENLANYYTKTEALKKSTNVLYVSSIFNTDPSRREYNTIREALLNFQEGNIIYLYPEHFEEDVTINGNEVSIFGVDKEKTSIRNLTFIGKNNYVKELKVSGDLSFLCIEDYEARNANQLRDCIIAGNVYIGTEDIINSYEVNIDGCNFIGIEKEWIFNGATGGNITWGAHWVRNSFVRDRIPGNTTVWNPVYSYHLKVYSGSLYFYYCPSVRFTTITYIGSTVLRFDHCGVFECENFNFDYDGTSLPSGEGHMVVNIEYTGFYFGWNNPIHMRYKTEFNILHSFFFTTGTLITFDSAAACRFVSVLEKVWGSTTSFTGSALANLHIFNSVFHCSSPGGLGTDSYNTWEAYIDY